MLCGFSPNALIHSFAAHPIDELSTDLDESQYPYRYGDKNYGKIYAFGQWSFDSSAAHMDFFSTPDFLIEKKENKINLEIRNPAKVDSKYMRKINKIYVQYRASLNPPKAGWGEKKGTKDKIRLRDQMIKDAYRQLRKDKPKIAARFLLDRVLESISPEFGGEISPETAKRIIYSKDDITNSGAKKK